MAIMFPTSSGGSCSCNCPATPCYNSSGCEVFFWAPSAFGFKLFIKPLKGDPVYLGQTEPVVPEISYYLDCYTYTELTYTITDAISGVTKATTYGYAQYDYCGKPTGVVITRSDPRIVYPGEEDIKPFWTLNWLEGQKPICNNPPMVCNYPDNVEYEGIYFTLKPEYVDTKTCSVTFVITDFIINEQCYFAPDDYCQRPRKLVNVFCFLVQSGLSVEAQTSGVAANGLPEGQFELNGTNTFTLEVIVHTLCAPPS